MKAVGYQKSLPIEDKDALVDFEAAKPEPKGRDIRVAVKAISANSIQKGTICLNLQYLPN